MASQDPRRAKLRTYFQKVLSGGISIRNSRDGKLFVEAVCNQPDAVACVQSLNSSATGTEALRLALSVDLSTPSLNGGAVSLFQYLQAPALKIVGSGQFLQSLLLNLVCPPIFWNAFLTAQKMGHLSTEASRCFAWLLSQLVLLPRDKAVTYYPHAQDGFIQDSLLNSFDSQTRSHANKIKHVMGMVFEPSIDFGDSRPGGRHDNDHEDISEISIAPTPDEINCTEDPYLRRSSDIDNIDGALRVRAHIDNQFRLLREDMLRDLREELPIARGLKKGRRRGMRIENLVLKGVECDDRSPWSVRLESSYDFLQMPRATESQRLEFLKENRNFLRNGSFGCLILDKDLAALVSIKRNENLLSQHPPLICITFLGNQESVSRAILQVRLAERIQLIQLNTAVFAYEPVLCQLQAMKQMPLQEEIMHWSNGKSVQEVSPLQLTSYQKIIAAMEDDSTMDLKKILDLPSTTKLDSSQAKCFVAGISQRMSLLQGPPGTGKSFIGALIAKAIYLCSQEKILVVCYTNHALDQFLDDLKKVGIPKKDIVRLGSAAKTSVANKSLLLSATDGAYRLTRTDYDVLNVRKAELRNHGDRLRSAFKRLLADSASKTDILEHLEFASETLDFSAAFKVPREEDGMMQIGKNGKAVSEFYLLDQWAKGYNPGIFARSIGTEYSQVWEMRPHDRTEALRRWKSAVLKERVTEVLDCGQQVNEALRDINIIYGENDRCKIREKRIIGCTTTGAANFVKSIHSASPGILLVEEAGEILESHILTALCPDTKQVILIGDHKQLRPKAHYDLCVEKGDGFDLNRSLFERLILKGYPHHVLSEQHRMRPEISHLVRCLTYPDLTDAPSTKGRPALRGFQDSLIFVNHEAAEEEAQDVADRRDQTSPSSKRNKFEAEMTLKCVRYLAQQGYGTDAIVVLTPYVAQLRLLYDVLGRENDPVLNDLDSYDLVRAGLMPAGTAKQLKRPLRVSTIDNYQGEESDIVVISLTRSNSSGDIGFLSQPERLNVLLSRAKNAMIMIGNATTFLRSRKGKALWQKLFELLKNESHIYDGFPVQCERHLDRKRILCRPEDFDQCLDGGCDEPCPANLSCGVHKCPQLCHQLFDHSKMECKQLMTEKCSAGHVLSWECFRGKSSVCKFCEKKKQDDEKKQRQAFERQQRRELLEQEHARQIAAIDEEIRVARENHQDHQRSQELTQALEQKKRDLENSKKLSEQTAKSPKSNSKSSTTSPMKTSPPPTKHLNDGNGAPTKSAKATRFAEQKPPPENSSKAEAEWTRLKLCENVSNDALDSLMKMTGLEQVKEQFLTIKSKIDTTLRQGTNMKKERLGAVFLGNPGTGKTTVARLYASFLAELGVVPGTEFVETTGSSLASDGVPGAKKHIDTLVKAGGGALFVDEAYQLTSGHNYGGKSVLDFILAEIENRVGVIVFIFAGYDKQMESFFEHNPGLVSRMPYRLRFEDYNDKELCLMLSRLIETKYSGKMQVDGGLHGLYMRIVARRVGSGRGREGFGNARALENALSKLSERQADRLRRERRAGIGADDFLLTREDLIGPDPAAAITSSSAWDELQALVGLAAVKDAVRSLIDRVKINYQRELREKPPVEVSLNRVFLGSPGTGKTTVARIYGQILADIGLLSSSEVVIKNPSDFTGSALGQSEEKTKAILKATEGKVLIIDEAYMLGSGSGVGQVADSYKTSIVDTIVAEVQSTPGEDRCVLLLGYEDQMRDMFRNTNPGLSRRFPLSDAFRFEDFDDEQLRKILDFKLNKQGLDATPEAKDIAIKVLSKARRRLNFGNAGEVENIISQAKGVHQLRQSTMPVAERSIDIIFEPRDFDADYGREKNAASNLQALFKDIVGSDDVVEKFEGYVRTVTAMRDRGRDPEDHIPFNFIFKGPPGTGKTTTARRIGQIYYDMGFLSSTDVHEKSATDLIAGFVGQTGLKTVELLDEALGSVLFIDEAYRLAEGQFAIEAVNALVDSLTKPRYMGKMLVVLAGYKDSMNDLLKVNPGLSSRFTEEIMFQNMSPGNAFKLLKMKLERAGIDTKENESTVTKIEIIFSQLSSLPSWGNGRDVETLAKSITRTTFSSAGNDDKDFVLTTEEIASQLELFLKERQAREKTSTHQLPPPKAQLPLAEMTFDPKPLNIISNHVNVDVSKEDDESKGPPEQKGDTQLRDQPNRDEGVSDSVWNQLAIDKQVAERTAAETAERLTTLSQNAQSAREKSDARAIELAMIKKQAEAKQASDELKRRHEAMRLKHLVMLIAQREAEEQLRRAQEVAEAKRKMEERAQQKLRAMGVCPAGFRWIKQAGGYRCSGGTHFVGDKDLT